MALALAPAPVRAAVYVRISSDPTGRRAGVERQAQDCVALADQLGWDVAQTFEDNDVSAFSRRRPAYLAMIAAVRSGEVNAVITWHPDRLYRQVRDLLDLIDLAKDCHLEVATVQAGDVDLSTASGRAQATTLAAWNQHESEHKAERQRAANAHRRAAGKRSSGSRHRRFGYQRDDVHLDEVEAPLVRAAVTRIIGGGSLHAICEEWAAAGMATTAGGRWRSTELRRYLAHAHLAGWVTYQGRPVLDGEGAPLRGPQEVLIAPDDFDALQRALDTRGRRPGLSKRSRLLAGFLRCGRCGQRLYAHISGNGKKAYRCLKAEGGCGGVSSLADPLERLVGEAVRKAITDAGGLGAALAEREGQRDEDLLGQMKVIEAKLANLLDLAEGGDIDRATYRARKAQREAELAAVQQKLAERAGRAALADVPAGNKLDEWWANPKTPLEKKRAVIGALVGEVVVAPAKVRGSTVFDPSRVEIVPRRSEY